MFYPQTIAYIRQHLVEWTGVKDLAGDFSQNAEVNFDTIRCMSRLGSDCTITIASYLAWMCQQIESWETDSAYNATKAGRWIGWIMAVMEENFLFLNKVGRRLVRSDVEMGFDLAHRSMVLGIDFGYTISWPNVVNGERVLIHNDPNFLSREFVERAPEAIADLVKIFGPASVHIVSKCEKEAEERIRQYLDAKEFWRLTGMRRENIRFCRERDQKFEICQELGITHFVDDRREVLHHLRGVGTRIALNPRDDDPDEAPFIRGPFRPDPMTRYQQAPIIVARNWPQVKDLILGSFNPTPSLVVR